MYTKTASVAGLLFASLAGLCIGTGVHAVARDSGISFVDSGQNLGVDDCFVTGLADLDADGDLDAFTIGGQNSAKIWTNDGSGTFIEGGQRPGLVLNHGVALGDLDGDEDVDAFLVHNNLQDWVYLNDGAGTVRP